MAAPRTHCAPASSIPPQVSTAMPKDRKLRLEPPPTAAPPPYEAGYRKPPAASPATQPIFLRMRCMFKSSKSCPLRACEQACASLSVFAFSFGVGSRGGPLRKFGPATILRLRHSSHLPFRISLHYVCIFAAGGLGGEAVESGNLSVNKAVVRWMSGNANRT